MTFVISLNEPVVVSGSALPAHFAAGADADSDGSVPDAASFDVLTAGLHTSATYVSQRVGQAGLQLALYPWAARALFNVPAGELAQATYHSDDICGPQIHRLREQLIETSCWQERFSQMNVFLRAQVDASERDHKPRPDVLAAWKWLVARHGNGSIGELAEYVHLSRRQLQTVFRHEFGVGAKEFNRLLRFERVTDYITNTVATGQRLDLAAVAPRFGFTDQPHLNREFKALAGATPTTWIDEELDTIQAGGHRNGGNGSDH